MRFLNVIIGVLIAIALSALLGLGTKAFHPSPVAPNYPNLSTSRPICEGIAVDCSQKQKDWDSQYEKIMAERLSLQTEYAQSMKRYNRDIFVINNIFGVLFFIGGFLITKLLTVKTAFAVGAGMVISGFYAIIIGYAAGWNSTDDRLKFFVGLVLFAILVGFSLVIGRQRKDQVQNEGIQIDNRS